jgi:Family of unknown function (DUF5317)
VIIGWARGGRLEALGRVPVRGLPLLGAAVAIALLALAAPLPQIVARALQGAGYLLALAALWLNRRHPWSFPILIGLGLNAAVIALNGGRMPVAPDALARLSRGLDPTGAAIGLDARHVIAGPGTRLAVLGDTIAVGVGRAGVIASAGDVLMALGVGGFVQGEMVGARAGPPGPVDSNV